MEEEIQSVQVSLAGLLKQQQIKRIVIPIIQRDYAQGRTNEQDIRDNFLDALKNYLEDDKKNTHDLDFVYGNVNSDKEFIPLDGQQRLTTLFLLHYYLSIHDRCYDSFFSIFVMDDGNPRFVYQTRSSSTDFCKALVQNPIDDIASIDVVSSVIENKCPWFSASWIYDPTVASMLNMLDSIAQRFKDTKDLYGRLMDEQFPAITFRVLFMRQNGLKDDLYIKMNSRGLELSPFENLKARIIQKLKQYKEKVYPLQRSKSKPSEMVTAKEYFSFKMDIDWSDLFWIYKRKHNRQTDDGDRYEIWDIDTPMLNFISTIALNYKALNDDVTNEELTNYDSLKWKFYSTLDNAFFLHLIKVLDLFNKDACLDESPWAGIYDVLKGLSKFNVRETFSNFLRKSYKDAAYDEHIRLFAYYEYLIHHGKNFDFEDFRQWMRIVMNLTTNSTWQDVSEFCRAMKTIKWLVENNTQGIIKLMAEGKNELRSAGFNPLQFHEERIKAGLLSRHDASDWEKKIEDAEKNGYFRGQILFLLNFSGIEDFYMKTNTCLWTEEDRLKYLNNFDRYFKLMELVFDDNGLRGDLTKNQILRRALLSYGPYGIPRGYYRKSFVINQSRDYSWRRYLQADNDEDSKQRRGYFKQLLDHYDKTIGFNDYLQKCIDKCPIDITDWCSIMVAEPQLWNHFGKDLFACFDNNGNDVYILSTKTMGGWHCELRTIYLLYYLNKEKYDTQYQWSQNWETFPSLDFNNRNGISFNVKYQNNRWNITYQSTEDPLTMDSTIVNVLESLGFKLENNKYVLKQMPFDETKLDSIAF